MKSKISAKPKVIAIVGPTASGKTALAIALARKWNGAVISADSRQVYKGMDIGTGKVTKKEARGVPHHLLDVVSPRRTFTVSDFQTRGTKALKRILRERKIPIVCGGTGFYIDALLYGYALPPVPPNHELRKKLGKKSVGELFRELRARDPARARTIDRKNPRRLLRALEIIHATNAPIPPLRKESPYEILKIGIDPGLAALQEKIGRRLALRLRHGLIAEVARLKKNGLSWARLDNFGLEYRFVSRYLRGTMSKKTMARELEHAIGRYAKRQRTWFKRDAEIRWIKKPEHALRITRNFLK